MPLHRSWRLVATVAGALVLLGLLAGCVEKCDQQEKDKVDQLTDQMVMATLWTQSSAEYKATCLQAFNVARGNLDAAVAEHQGDRPMAIIADCDDTLMSSARYAAWEITSGNHYTSKTWAEWLDKDKPQAVPGATEFLRHAADQGVEVYYVTNRPTRDRAATLNQIKDLELPLVDEQHLLLREGDERDKTSRREQVAETHDVLLLLGDQLTDFDQVFAGGTPASRATEVEAHAEEFGARFIVLPNPLYGVWENILYSDLSDPTPADKVQQRLKALDPWAPKTAPQ